MTVIVAIIVAVLGILYSQGYLDGLLQREEPPVPVEGQVELHFIDVGQGDAALIRTSEGHVLIDAGTNASEEALVAYLKAEGITKLAYAVFTHPHEDHYGGASEIMESFSVKELILHKELTEVYPYNRLIDMAEDYGTDVILTEMGDRFEFDGCAEFEILSPKYVDEDNLNEASLCFRVEFGNTAFMFTGDAEEMSENFMLLSGKPLEADVLKAGHHGSSTSNTRDFVEAVNPVYAVVSCAENNDYGHPHRETVRLFDDMDIEMLVTHQTDGVVFVSDGEEVTYVEDFFGNNDSASEKTSDGNQNMFFRYISSRF